MRSKIGNSMNTQRMSDIYTFVLLEYLVMGYLCIPLVFYFLIIIELLLFHFSETDR